MTDKQLEIVNEFLRYSFGIIAELDVSMMYYNKDKVFIVGKEDNEMDCSMVIHPNGQVILSKTNKYLLKSEIKDSNKVKLEVIFEDFLF